MSTPAAFSGDGYYIAFDTSGNRGSVAVGRGSEVLADAVLDDRSRHASSLVPAIDAILREAGVDRGDLKGVVVGEGPGSFTGVRVAGATAKGLCQALRIPLWPISSLAATALACGTGAVRYVLFDARSDRVYGACYGVGAAGVQTLVPPHAGELRDVLAGDVPHGAVFSGDGASHHRMAIEAAGFGVAEGGSATSVASGLLAYLVLADNEHSVADVASWEPRYIRPWRAGPSWKG